MKCLFIFFVVIFAASCGSDTYLIVSENLYDKEVKQEIYSDYWSALSHFEYDQALEFCKMSKDMEKIELTLILKSMFYNSFQATDTTRLVKLINGTNNDTIKFHATRWNSYYKALNFMSAEFLESFNINHSDLYISETKYLRDSLPILNRQMSPIIRVYINDQAFNLIFNTGNSFTVLKQSALENLKLKQIDNVFLPLANWKSDTIASCNTIIPNIKFDKISLKNIPVYVTEDKGFYEAMKFVGDSTLEISGILGWDFIKRFNIRLDFKNNFLVLNQRHKAPVIHRQVFGMSNPYTSILLDNGEKKIVMINSGAVRSMLNQAAFGNKIESLEKQVIDVISINGITNDSIVYKSCTLYIDDYKYEMGSMIMYKGVDETIKPAGSLGNDVFNLGGFVLDYEAGCFKPYYYDKVKFE